MPLSCRTYEEIKSDKRAYAKSFYTQYCNTDPFSGKRLFETYDEKMFVVQNPPQKPLSKLEMDQVYDLPYMRAYHPSYESAGGVPAISEVKFSLISNRGCFGGCSFCALTFHQGRIIQARSHESILKEANNDRGRPEFKGYIHDVGGPTANFRAAGMQKAAHQRRLSEQAVSVPETMQKSDRGSQRLSLNCCRNCVHFQK